MVSHLVFFFVLSITFSFLCSLWEAVLLSITPVYAQIQITTSPVIGKKLRDFKDNIDRPLAAILTLNTMAHTIGAIGVGAQAALIWHDSHPLITTLIVPLLMTLAILFLSEIIPKTIGANFWQSMVPFTISSVSILVWVFYPIVILCELITRFLRNGEKSVLTRSDFVALAEIGTTQGTFKEGESELIERTLDLTELHVTDVMRPSEELISLNIDQKNSVITEIIEKYRFSRFPVVNNENTILGIIHIKDLIPNLIKKPSYDFSKIIRPIQKVSYNLPVLDLFRRFREGTSHFALVYKGKDLIGFVTLDNVLHVVYGRIRDEFNRTQDDWFIQPDGSIMTTGDCSIYSLERALDKDIDTDDDESDITTLTGLLLSRLGRLPHLNEPISFKEFEAKVLSIQGTLLKKILITPKNN